MTERDAQSDDLRHLLMRVSDGTLDEAGWAQLDALLDGDAEAQAVYLDHVTHEALLMREYSDAPSTDALPEAKIEPEIAGRIGTGAIGAIAAAVLIAGGVAIYAVSIATEPTPEPTPGPQVATLLSSDGAAWETQRVRSGEPVRRAPLQLRSGTVELETTTGVAMVLRGPVSARLDAPGRVHLERGLLRARVPAGAEGFTVTLPGGVRVVDLGTEFAIRADGEGGEDVFVLEGAVEVHVPGQPVRRVAANEAVHVDANGTRDRAFIDATIARLDLPHPDAEYDAPGPLQRGLVYHERFDGRVDTPVDDGAISPRFAPGRVGTAAAFDGDDDEHLVGEIAELDGADAMTVSLWARRTRANDSAALFIHRLDDDTTLHGFTTTPHGPGRAQFRIADRSLDTPDHALPLDGTWVHLVGVWERGRSMRVYVNGEPAASLDAPANVIPKSALNAGGDWRFGNDTCCGPHRHLQGGIDDAAIWNRALSDHEVRSLYLQSAMGRDAGAADMAPRNKNTGGDNPRKKSESDEKAPV